MKNSAPSLKIFRTKFSTSALYNGRNKMKNIKEETRDRNRHNVECFFERVLYFGWPNQPSSGIMENFASGRVFMKHITGNT